MDTRRVRIPVLVIYYNRYLTNNDCSIFLKRVARRYSCATLERLATVGDHTTRRAAVLALSLLGDYSSNAVLGRALVDRDRGVRTIAESGIRELWCRVSDRRHREKLRAILELNDQRRHEEAARLATELIHDSPWIAEAWCQRGIAHYHMSQYEAAIRDCHQALEINPYHFTAAAGMGQCYLVAGQPRRRAGSFSSRSAAQSRAGRGPHAGRAAAALAQTGLAARLIFRLEFSGRVRHRGFDVATLLGARKPHR